MTASSLSRLRSNHRLRPLTLLRTAYAWLRHVWTVDRERQVLAQLSPHELADIGLTDHAARHEARRAFWDLPPRNF